ncbi:MAG: adenylate/guanylate cyclase domain-containing protein [Deltaproteobacteria bacterium]|nr:adenylate/guanylate cyclase domain-containing protein [Deltaproteobacteria bacterium]
MTNQSIDKLLNYLIQLTKEVSQGRYNDSREIFEFTKSGRYPENIVDLAESFGMMMVKIEAREFQLEGMIEELREKNAELEKTLRKVEILENIKKHLGRFVPRSVKRIIESKPENPDLQKQNLDVSVLFLDLAGYTRMSEKLDAEKMNLFIEMYFSSFLDDIHQHNGDINETAGDGLMVIFQDEEKTQHAVNAVRTAIAIQEKVRSINRDLEGHFQPILVNIGINSGNALVGSTCFEGITGSRFTFTASGPLTNLAARIGALARNGEILVGEETAMRTREKFSFKDLGPQELKNVGEPIRVFQVL